MRLSDTERFEKFIEMIPECGCWIWMGKCDKNGYGMFWFNGMDYRAHRAAYELYKGCPVPEGKFALHRCDTPACVNPYHLFAGTNSDNLRDMVAKGRSIRGTMNNHCKLTEQDVVKIRADNRSQSKIALDYGVWQTTISQIKNNKIWKHLLQVSISKPISSIPKGMMDDFRHAQKTMREMR